MTVRRTFLLLVVPLFLTLAAVNGALLYVWEKAEAERGLEQQAVAAAVTTAAFASGADDLAHALADPMRAAALSQAAAHITGLEGLFVVAADGAGTAIAGRATDVPRNAIGAPTTTTVLPIRVNAAGRPVAVAVAPASGGRYVVAEIDAAPLFAQLRTLERVIAAVVAGAGLIGLALAWRVAGRIGRELAVTGDLIASEAAGRAAGLSIRETKDLANAVRLMRTSVSGRLSRSARELALNDRRRDEAGAVAAFRGEVLPPVSATAAGVAVAARALGRPPPGSFHALAAAGDHAGLVLGEAAGEGPAAALAGALAARRYFERALLDGDPAARVAQGQAAFGLTRVVWAAWRAGDPVPPILALLDRDNAGRAAAYAGQAQGLSPDAIVEDLAALLDANGLVAVLSAEGGQR